MILLLNCFSYGSLALTISCPHFYSSDLLQQRQYLSKAAFDTIQSVFDTS